MRKYQNPHLRKKELTEFYNSFASFLSRKVTIGRMNSPIYSDYIRYIRIRYIRIIVSIVFSSYYQCFINTLYNACSKKKKAKLYYKTLNSCKVLTLASSLEARARRVCLKKCLAAGICLSYSSTERRVPNESLIFVPRIGL